MVALAKEHARGAVQLGYHHALCAVDHEGSLGRHVGDVAQEYVLYNGLEINMLLIVAGKPQLGLQGDAVGEAALHTLINRIARGIDVVVQKLEYKDVARIRDRKILAKHFVEPLVDTILRRRLQLEEFLK